MGCSCSRELREEYPETVFVLFCSSTEQNNPQTDAFITNAADGFMPEIEAVGQGSLTPGNKKLSNAGNDPYSTRLRLVTDVSKIIAAPAVFVEKVEWFGYDTTLTGSVVQDAATLAAIYASKATDDAYAQSLFRNAMLMNWQPNWFRPEFWCDTKNLLGGLDGSNYSKLNLGDMSIGIPVPYCFSLEKEIGRVKDIKAYGQLAQLVGGARGVYQRYMVLCMATFWISNQRKKLS